MILKPQIFDAIANENARYKRNELEFQFRQLYTSNGWLYTPSCRLYTSISIVHLNLSIIH